MVTLLDALVQFSERIPSGFHPPPMRFSSATITMEAKENTTMPTRSAASTARSEWEGATNQECAPSPANHNGQDCWQHAAIPGSEAMAGNSVM